MALDYTSFGGTLVTPYHAKAAFYGAENEATWNFGLYRQPSLVQTAKDEMIRSGQPRGLYDAAPHIKGIGVGKTVLLQHLAKKTIGGFLRAQYQSRGTCVSRGAKRTTDLVQILMLATGYAYDFKYVSHALIYGACREYGHDLSREDGAVGAWAAWAVANVGNLTNEDVGDDDNKDDLAVEWGWHGVPADIKSKAAAHKILEIVPIHSVEEARDFLCAGFGAITVASGVGYEGTRNSDGVIRRRGSWSHQMMYSGYRPDLEAGGAFLQEQSWGPDQPGGSMGSIEIPNYSWWTLSTDAAVQIRENDCFGYKMVKGWDAVDVSLRP